MKKLGFLLLAMFASKGAIAAEVGAPFPQLANTNAVLAVAIAETGTSATGWALEPISKDTANTQHATLNDYAEVTLEKLTLTTRERILSQLENYQYLAGL